MTSEIENAEKNIKQTSVTAVGNAWVICNSKSRPGLKYYFNTFTGHAVWNLSPIEIEKAKKYTKAIPISEIEKCPEPNTDPPMDYTIDPTHTSSQFQNEQIIRSQCPNQITNMFPLNMLNSVPTISGYNPNVWNNPPNNAAPTPQVIYVAYQPPMNFQTAQEYPQQVPFKHYQSNNFDAQKEYSQNMCTKTNNIFNKGNTFNRVNRLNNNRSRFSQNGQHSHVWNVNSSDLRQKLKRKRSKSFSFDTNIKHEDTYQEINTNHENVITQRNTQETPSKYDLSVLKQLKLPHSKANNWFIVVDTDIVLNNFPFLNKITDPDQNCYLMVPHNVMGELQLLASSDSDVRSRRIYRFLSAHIDSELAFKGDDMTDVADSDIEKTFATCVETAIQNNVILLSNDVKFQTYKNNRHNVIILTLNELKMMLNEPIKEVPTRTKSPTLDIKIIVSNERKFERNATVPLNQIRPKTPNFEITPLVIKKKEVHVQSDLPTASSKRTTNTQKNSDLEEHAEKINHTPVIIVPEPISVEKRLENLSVNNTEKKEVKLYRSNTNQKTIPEVNNSTQTKQFRWRKQRRTNNQSNLSKASSVTSDHAVSVEDNKAHETITTFEKPSNLGVSPKNTISASRTPSIDRSSVSSQYKRFEHPNVVIEETSTSGVISNTTLDCESVSSDIKKTVSICEDVNYEVFQILGQSMEEVLRTRREEWVLRFVQIMEEVLREQLRDDSPSQSKDYAPPWATDLPELARCIIKKFSDHFNVVDAANRLSFTLQRISDSKGNVSANIEPGQYMDMYSFGVYLIQSLKSVTKDCEDLNIADESLKKLLYDIQNVNLDCSHNDAFADDLNESAIRLPQCTEELPQMFPDSGSIKSNGNEDLNERQSSKSSYMLRSRKKTPTKVHNESQRISTPQKNSTPQPQNSMPQEQVSINVETNFFSSLELSKRLNTNTTSFVNTLDFMDTPHSTPKTNNDTQTPPRVPPSPKTPSLPDKQSVVQVTSIKETDTNNKDACSTTEVDNITGTSDRKNTSPVVKTSFVRNFTSIAQFEKKLLTKQINDLDEEAEEYEDDNYDAYADIYYDDNEETNAGEDDIEDGKIAGFEAIKIAGSEKDKIAETDNGKYIEYGNEKDANSANERIAEFDTEKITECNKSITSDFVDGLIDEFEDGEIHNEPQLEEALNCNGKLVHSDIDNNKKFKCFITEFIGEIKESFEAVRKLCVETIEEMKNSQESSPCMMEKLRAACAVMLKISNHLNSILDRESRRPEGNIMLLLKKANLEGFVPNDELRVEYADIISKCRDQAFTCYKTVTLIMKRADIKKVV